VAPLMALAAGANGAAEHEDTRRWLAADWLIRVYGPTWLRLAGLNRKAKRLASLPRVDPDTSNTLQVLATIRPGTWFDGEAASEVSWMAAGSAAGEAARSAGPPEVTEAAWRAIHPAVRRAAGRAPASMTWTRRSSQRGWRFGRR
jgi:hypothetical protein